MHINGLHLIPLLVILIAWLAYEFKNFFNGD